MKIFVYCKHCGEEIFIPGSFSTKTDMKMRLGNFMELHCNKCKSVGKYEIKKMRAKGGIIVGVAFLFFLISSSSLMYLLYPYAMKSIISVFLLPLAILIPGVVLTVFWGEIRRKVDAFNSSSTGFKYSRKLKRRF
jgi:hypothetical protein